MWIADIPSDSEAFGEDFLYPHMNAQLLLTASCMQFCLSLILQGELWWNLILVCHWVPCGECIGVDINHTLGIKFSQEKRKGERDTGRDRDRDRDTHINF